MGFVFIIIIIIEMIFIEFVLSNCVFIIFVLVLKLGRNRPWRIQQVSSVRVKNTDHD
jgi:hypothetical protein